MFFCTIYPCVNDRGTFKLLALRTEFLRFCIAVEITMEPVKNVRRPLNWNDKSQSFRLMSWTQNVASSKMRDGQTWQVRSPSV